MPDDHSNLRETVQQALADHDLVLVNAGSSAGSHDYNAYRAGGLFKEAIRVFEENLETCQEALGADHPASFRNHSSLANC